MTLPVTSGSLGFWTKETRDEEQQTKGGRGRLEEPGPCKSPCCFFNALFLPYVFSLWIPGCLCILAQSILFLWVLQCTIVGSHLGSDPPIPLPTPSCTIDLLSGTHSEAQVGKKKDSSMGKSTYCANMKTRAWIPSTYINKSMASAGGRGRDKWIAGVG